MIVNNVQWLSLLLSLLLRYCRSGCDCGHHHRYHLSLLSLLSMLSILISLTLSVLFYLRLPSDNVRAHCTYRSKLERFKNYWCLMERPLVVRRSSIVNGTFSGGDWRGRERGSSDRLEGRVKTTSNNKAYAADV